MINFIRATVKLVLFFIFALMVVVFVAAGNLLLRIFNKQLVIRWKNLVVKKWAAFTALILGIKIKAKGKPPQPPFFLVSNHLSYIDVVPLWLYLDTTFIAKSEVRSWPFFGLATRVLGVLFINRELKRDVHRMNQRISEAISDEQGIVLFPEGTSTKGEKVLPFNTSLLHYPADSKIPVHYAAISYTSFDTSRPAQQKICWWGDMAFSRHFWELLKMPGFEVNIQFGEREIINDNRKKLAQQLHEAVSELFIPCKSRQHKT